VNGIEPPPDRCVGWFYRLRQKDFCHIQMDLTSTKNIFIFSCLSYK